MLLYQLSEKVGRYKNGTSLLRKVQGQKRDQRPEENHNEKWQTGDPGCLPGLRYQNLQNRWLSCSLESFGNSGRTLYPIFLSVRMASANFACPKNFDLFTLNATRKNGTFSGKRQKGPSITIPNALRAEQGFSRLIMDCMAESGETPVLIFFFSTCLS
jgi:hypothetical protein